MTSKSPYPPLADEDSALSAPASNRNSLTWKQGRYSASYGIAGGVRLFTSWYASDKADIAAGTPYVLSCELPGFTSKRWKVTSQEVAQQKAERLLAAWLERITGAAS